MGLFCLPKSSPGKETIEDLVTAAIGNLNIYKDHISRYPDKAKDMDYLLAFAAGYIEDIERKLK